MRRTPAAENESAPNFCGQSLWWVLSAFVLCIGVVWGPFGLALLFCTGFWMSARTGFFQFRKMGYWLRHTIGAIFTNKDITAHTSKEDCLLYTSDAADE